MFKHTSEIRGLRLMKCLKEMLQKGLKLIRNFTWVGEIHTQRYINNRYYFYTCISTFALRKKNSFSKYI